MSERPDALDRSIARTLNVDPECERLRAELAAAQQERDGLWQRVDHAEGALAGLADCINEALREDGPVDVTQISNYLRDMRPYVRGVVDLVRKREARAAQQREAVLVEAARLQRNVILRGKGLETLEGEWVAVPREDFQKLRAIVGARIAGLPEEPQG